MQLTDIARIILLILLIVCAVGVNFGKSLLQAVIIFMSYSSIMCILWVILESPDLAITEAAVGAVERAIADKPVAREQFVQPAGGHLLPVPGVGGRVEGIALPALAVVQLVAARDVLRHQVPAVAPHGVNGGLHAGALAAGADDH